MSPAINADDNPAQDAAMVAPTRFLRASWSSTLRLPKSSFPPRPLPASKPEYLRRCTDEFYAWQQSRPLERDTAGSYPKDFTLHDGPPYANGPLHIGHALNKITKDLICRFRVSEGRRVSYIPGWDCHGLPIEMKALQAQQKDLAQTDPVSVREAARELATTTVEEQKEGFKEWAVMADWDNAYKTMDKDFEIRQLHVFKKMFEKGVIYRQFKPVHWSPSSRTALAEAELEYDENFESLAAFVRFPVLVKTDSMEGALAKFSKPLNVVIWTTTPWTLPANKAIAVHKDMEYCIIRDPAKNDELVIIAASRVEEYQKMLGRDLTVVSSGLRGSDLAGQLTYQNPFQKQNGRQPILLADFVTDSSGTGLVHMAPGHGMDDYHVCAPLGIEAFAPIDDAGTFTRDAFPEQPELLEGLAVSDPEKSGSNAILDYLDKHDLLRAKHKYHHKYPIDWRTKQPVIVRATAQWFANVDNLKSAAMKAIEHVNFMPETGRSRLESFIQGRSQWCISRQRAWGVPIPALYKVLEDGQLEAAMDAETVQHIIDVIKERGINAWWTDAQDDPAWKPQHLSGKYVRGRDTMDVWFDSGTTWTMLPERSLESPPSADGTVNRVLADVYLEGTDQHRGWFQSSLLTHVATQSFDKESVSIKPPYNTLITHGFTLDSAGRKMSKSLGNVIAPSQIMSGELLPPVKRKKQKGAKQAEPKDASPTYDVMGPDALRLWVASSDYTRDVSIGQPVLMSVNQALHKYRVTFKWLLGVLSLPSCPPTYTSFHELRHEIAGKRDTSAPATPLPNLADELALSRLAQVSHEVHNHYDNYEFFKGIATLNKYITNDLSAFYFETLKDRIYTGRKADCQDVQKVLGLVFYELLQMLTPVCPLLVEEVWDHVPAHLKEGSTDEYITGTPNTEPDSTLIQSVELRKLKADLLEIHSGIARIKQELDCFFGRGRPHSTHVAHPARTMWNPLPRADTGTQTFLSTVQTRIDTVSSAVKAAQERLRAAKKIGGSLECGVTVVCAPDDYLSPLLSAAMLAYTKSSEGQQTLTSAQLEELAGVLVISDVNIVSAADAASLDAKWAFSEEEPFCIDKEKGWGGKVIVHEAKGAKCPRCWRYQRSVEEELCGRCEEVVKEQA
ncbi:isoleucyl-tRNA synthetase [Bimuria novae-zelandiae CBS 107.79]|uniref:Isoleucine--tRNA ligase, mitochondrial n=1 Tax=Bimuria novae-zelandiae CBS 107.79 TaxID=1447943 RepID=A0A6A5VE44_9PLEO|nr:isoleucyl-tRNA synthetase [Bimuria novae-zelandiae CBS 107.79]